MLPLLYVVILNFHSFCFALPRLLFFKFFILINTRYKISEAKLIASMKKNFNFGFFERKKFLQGSVEILHRRKASKGGNRKAYKRKRLELFRECTPRWVLPYWLKIPRTNLSFVVFPLRYVPAIVPRCTYWATRGNNKDFWNKNIKEIMKERTFCVSRVSLFDRL